MNPKQQQFVEFYLIDANASEAYSKAYPGSKRTTAAANGEKLLRKAEIKEAIEAGKIKLQVSCSITKEQIIQDLIEIKNLNKIAAPNAAIKALELLTKMFGLQAPSQSEITLKGEQPLFSPLDESEEN